MDLPQFTVMPAGLDDWEPIWKRRQTIPTIDEPRLLTWSACTWARASRSCGRSRGSPRPAPSPRRATTWASPPGCFPQWLRCTGCDFLGPLSQFNYTNTHPFRPDLAGFEHLGCPGRGRVAPGQPQRRASRVAAPPSPRDTCWPARTGTSTSSPTSCGSTGEAAAPKPPNPDLKLRDTNLGQGASAVVICEACGATRGMGEAQGERGRRKLPPCRGRHPHLDAFEPGLRPRHQADDDGRVEPVVRLHPVDRRDAPHRGRAARRLADQSARPTDAEKLTKYAASRTSCGTSSTASSTWRSATPDLAAPSTTALTPAPSEEERQERLKTWDPIELRVPEWNYLQNRRCSPGRRTPAD